MLIYAFLFPLFLVGMLCAGYWFLFHEEDHGEVTEIKAWWRMPGFYDDYTIESGDEYIICDAFFEDGTHHHVDDWEIDKPTTLHKGKKAKFTVTYRGQSCKVVVDPKKYETTQPTNSNVNMSRAQQNYSLAEELIVNYPGHERQYYLDMLVQEGLTYNEADAALQCAGY